MCYRLLKIPVLSGIVRRHSASYMSGLLFGDLSHWDEILGLVHCSDRDCLHDNTYCVGTRYSYVANIIRCLSRIPRGLIYPIPERALRMFRVMHPESIRVVMIGQDPYKGTCLYTGEQYAYGIAYYVNPRAVGVPKSLRNLAAEVVRTYPGTSIVDHNAMLCRWMSQGVFLTNMALTTSADTHDHVHDHSVMWGEFMRCFIKFVTRVNPDVIFVLMGRMAWDLERDMLSSRCIRTPHPVVRDNSFVGCNIFLAIDNMMMSLGVRDTDRISW
jgi:uracil-DNA glycosylase